MSARVVVLSFERGRWRACGDGVDIAHRELRALEALIETRLASEARRRAIKFDMAALPRWLHQYRATTATTIACGGGARS
jgi:hypothetical protein